MDKSEVNKLVTKAKKVWSYSKRRMVYDDKIERAENALFVNDEHLAGLIAEKEAIDESIIEYIDDILAKARINLPKEKSDKEVLVNILNRVLATFKDLDEMVDSNNNFSDEFDIVDYSDLVTDITEYLEKLQE